MTKISPLKKCWSHCWLPVRDIVNVCFEQKLLSGLRKGFVLELSGLLPLDNLHLLSKNWHKHWCCSWTPFRQSTDNDHSGPLFSLFLPLNFLIHFFCFLKILFKNIYLVQKWWLSLEEFCRWDRARLHFPAFKKLLSHLVRFGTSLPAGWSKVAFSNL